MTKSDTPHTPPRADSPLAVASMVCGAMSLSGAGLLLGIPALILGIVALKRDETGRGLSIAGIVTGAVSTFLSILFILFVIALMIWGASMPPADHGSEAPASPAYDSSKL